MTLERTPSTQMSQEEQAECAGCGILFKVSDLDSQGYCPNC